MRRWKNVPCKFHFNQSQFVEEYYIYSYQMKKYTLKPVLIYNTSMNILERLGLKGISMIICGNRVVEHV